MEEVALRAEVSLATVDRVLHGRSGVRAATVQRVMRAAADLGYISDAQAQARGAVGAKPLRLSFLIREFCRLSGETIYSNIGAIVPWNEIATITDRKAILQYLYDAVFALGTQGTKPATA